MKIKRRNIKYIVDNAKQAKSLERIMKKLPIEIEIEGSSKLFSSFICVYEGENKSVIIKPSQGKFSKIKFGKKVKVIDFFEYNSKISQDKKYFLIKEEINLIGFYKGKEYYISNNPFFRN